MGADGDMEVLRRGRVLVTGGYDGKIRIYDSSSGTLVKAFVPVPIKSIQQASLSR